MPFRAAASVAVLTALLALGVPPGEAQAEALGPALVLADPAGDVKTEVGGQAAAGGEAAYPATDLLGLTVEETPFSLAITVQAAALPKPSDAGVDGVLYHVGFLHNGREFRVTIQMVLQVLVADRAAGLAYRDLPTDEWSFVWSTEAVVMDTAAGTLAVDVPRDLLADKDGAAPYPGRALEGVHAVAQSLFTDSGLVFISGAPLVNSPQRVTDTIPDAAPYPALPVQFGLAQTGDARLSAATPFRASNGEATTFVYEVVTQNLGEAADAFELAASSVPAGFAVVLPVPVVALEGRSNDTVPVLLTIPFGHDHGARASFVLELRSTSDPGSVGRLEMGVRFLDVPQPAGHHDTVYLHQAVVPGGIGTLLGSQGYMNTLEEDPNDSGAKDCSRGFSSTATGTWQVSWPFYLEPTLVMGLDVDAAKVGHVRVPIATTFPTVDAQFYANLYVEPPRDENGRAAAMTHIAGIPGTAVEFPGGGATVVVEADLLPSQDAGRVPYQAGHRLVLWFTLQFKGPNSLGFADEAPCIMPGGSARLPLREWHDEVDEVLAAIDGPGLSPLGPQERLVNPGEAVVFPVSIANPLAEDVRFDLDVSGPNAAWATLVDEAIDVPAHGTAKASVIIRAPAGAIDGERADLVLQAYPRDDPTARGLLRLVAEVDTDIDHADDSAVAAAETKGSPGANPLLLLAALAGLALGVRRRGGI